MFYSSVSPENNFGEGSVIFSKLYYLQRFRDIKPVRSKISD